MNEARKEAKKKAEKAEEKRWIDLLKIWGPVTILAAVAFVYTFSKVEPPAPDELKIATGNARGAYHGFAEQYRAFLAAHEVELTIVDTAGSIENLRLLESGEVDLALVQGGVIDESAQSRLEALGSVFLEPVWIFHRAELEVERLTDLTGRRIAIGPEGSGTRPLALELLADNGVTSGEVTSGGVTSEGITSGADSGASGATTFVDLGSEAAADALAAGEVDAAFFVASSSAAYVERLLAADGVALMSLQRFRAYQVRHPFLSHVVLGEGVIDLDANLPPADVSMVAAAASLVARDDLHHALVPVLIETLQAVHGSGGLFEGSGDFPSERFVDLPMNTEAAHYIENGPSFLYRILPYRTAVAVDRLKILLLPFIPILLVVFKLAPPIYRWSIRSKIYRWYEDLRELDLLVLHGPDDRELARALETLERVEEEVTEVQVPLSYMDEFYNLRVHIELIETKLRELRGVEPGAADSSQR